MKVSIMWSVAEQMAEGWHATFKATVKASGSPAQPLALQACAFLHLYLQGPNGLTLRRQIFQHKDSLMGYHLNFRVTTLGLAKVETGLKDLNFAFSSAFSLQQLLRELSCSLAAKSSNSESLTLSSGVRQVAYIQWVYRRFLAENGCLPGWNQHWRKWWVNSEVVKLKIKPFHVLVVI